MADDLVLHRRMSADRSWDAALARLPAAGMIDWAVAHQHATNVTCHRGRGRITRIRASSRLTMALAALGVG